MVIRRKNTNIIGDQNRTCKKSRKSINTLTSININNNVKRARISTVRKRKKDIQEDDATLKSVKKTKT